jgi:hypothetical protein
MPGATVSQEEKSGIVANFYATDTGMITEDGTGTSRDFYQDGASVIFVVGDSVRYTLITLPSGKTIVAGIRKPN